MNRRSWSTPQGRGGVRQGIGHCDRRGVRFWRGRRRAWRVSWKGGAGVLRQTIAIREQLSFDAVEVGLGLGLTNGLIWGMVIGMVKFAVFAWKESHRPLREGPASLS
jgi:hypothetical protein